MTANISCESEIKIYDFLVKVRKNNPEYYEPVKRILGYLYKTVKKEFFHKKADYFLKIEKKDATQNTFDTEKTLFKHYVDGENGILDNLIKIVINDPKYFEYFYLKIEPFFEMSDNGIYSEYDIYKYVFNIYTILELYNLHPNDFESFKAIVDDLSNFFITSILNMDIHLSHILSSDIPSFNTKQDIIVALLSIPNYNEHPKIKEEIKKVLDEINCIYEDSLIEQYEIVTKTLLELYSEIEKQREKGYKISSQTVEQLEDDIMTNIVNSKKHDSFYHEPKKQAGSELVIYTPVLLLKERFETFKNMLFEAEDNQKIRKDILNYIQKIDNDFLEYLEKITLPKDPFIKCMEIVFDSDTYYEVESKLIDLVEANKVYQNDEAKALELIKGLNSVKHKQVIDGVVMSWPENNSINKIDKPVRIIDRMMKLQQTLEFAPEEKFYKNRSCSIYRSLTLKNFSDSVLTHMNEEKKEHINKLERKRKEEEEALLKQQEEQRKKIKGLGSLFGKKNNN